MTGRLATLHTEDGIALQARWDVPADPRLTAVVCHPHPRYGGTMEVPLLRTVTACLVAVGCAVLRFNFRGVGESAGAWSDGRGEVADLAAAAAAALGDFPGLPLGLAGWSFGALVALTWQSATGGRQPLVGIAPPTRVRLGLPLPDPASLTPARRLLVVGSRDQYADVTDLQAYAAAAGAELQILPESDHFFFARERRVGEAVATHLSEAVAG
jgi:alpha/beta superfamily hydrolase